MKKSKKSEPIKKPSKNLLVNFILIFLIINFFLALLTGFILFKQKIEPSTTYGIISFFIYSILTTGYIYMNKKRLEDISKSKAVYSPIFVLAYIGICAMFIVVVSLINGIFTVDILDFFLLSIFCLFIGGFLFKNIKNLNQEGIMLLYRTQAGVNFIDYVGGNFKKTLGFFKWIIIGTGYVLMAGIIYLISRSVLIYVTNPVLVTKIIKAPPIAPVIPYFPQIFGMQSFFPNFSFVYFIVALAVVAIVHEFSHGIYMKFNNVRIKSTGIVFLGPILGAFVEQNDKDLEKRSKSAQMSILGAGVFANMIFALIFLIIWIGLFYATFVPSGAMFGEYAQGLVATTNVTMIGGIVITNSTPQAIIDKINSSNLSVGLVMTGPKGEQLNMIKIVADNTNYYTTEAVLKQQLTAYKDYLILYLDMPAIRDSIAGTIVSIDSHETNTHTQLINVLKLYRPGDKAVIRTRLGDQVKEYNIVFGKNPLNPSIGMLGVKDPDPQTNIAENAAFFFLFKDQFTDYKISSEILSYFYYMVFWIFLINFLVAFFNMLPASIFDGGRFFYLTVWGILEIFENFCNKILHIDLKINGKEKIAKAFYNWSGYILLFLVVLMMLGWTFGIVFGRFF